KGAPPDARVQSRGAGETVHHALQKLSSELREAVILRDLQDMDYREIAAVLRVPEGTVKSRINRGRAELARLLQRTYRQVMRCQITPITECSAMSSTRCSRMPWMAF